MKWTKSQTQTIETDSEDIGNLNKQRDLVLKNLPKKTSPNQDGFTGEFYELFKKELISSKKEKRRKHFLTHSTRLILL